MIKCPKDKVGQDKTIEQDYYSMLKEYTYLSYSSCCSSYLTPFMRDPSS
jgi:hypothetical protein